jgi:hypothetical protein
MSSIHHTFMFLSLSLIFRSCQGASPRVFRSQGLKPQGLKPHKREPMRGASMVKWFSPRRDSPIVARHFVPGCQARSAWNHQENSPVPEGRLKSLSVPNGTKLRNVCDVLRVG